MLPSTRPISFEIEEDEELDTLARRCSDIYQHSVIDISRSDKMAECRGTVLNSWMSKTEGQMLHCVIRDGRVRYTHKCRLRNISIYKHIYL